MKEVMPDSTMGVVEKLYVNFFGSKFHAKLMFGKTSIFEISIKNIDFPKLIRFTR